MMRRNGFTLVEGLVTAVIAAIAGLAIYSLFQMTMQQSLSGTLHSMLNMRYETVMGQLASTIRRSNCVLQSAEVWPPYNLAAVDNVTTLIMKNAMGSDTGGYQISGNVLQERVNSGGTWVWQNFKVGDSAITLAAGSHFNISDDRKTVGITLSVIGVSSNLKDTIYSRGESFLCRN